MPSSTVCTNVASETQQEPSSTVPLIPPSTLPFPDGSVRYFEEELITYFKLSYLFKQLARISSVLRAKTN